LSNQSSLSELVFDRQRQETAHCASRSRERQLKRNRAKFSRNAKDFVDSKASTTRRINPSCVGIKVRATQIIVLG
jgi:hypothetical protein